MSADVHSARRALYEVPSSNRTEPLHGSVYQALIFVYCHSFMHVFIFSQCACCTASFRARLGTCVRVAIVNVVAPKASALLHIA